MTATGASLLLTTLVSHLVPPRVSPYSQFCSSCAAVYPSTCNFSGAELPWLVESVIPLCRPAFAFGSSLPAPSWVKPEALKAELYATETRSESELASAIDDCVAACHKIQAALSEARAAAAREQRLGSKVSLARTPDGELERDAAAAVKAYRDFVLQCSSSHVMHATEAAIEEVRQDDDV